MERIPESRCDLKLASAELELKCGTSHCCLPPGGTQVWGKPGTGGTMTTEEIRLHPCWRLATHVRKRREWSRMELATQPDYETNQALHEVVVILSKVIEGASINDLIWE